MRSSNGGSKSRASRRFLSRRNRAVCLTWALLAGLGGPSRASAQEMEVPVEVQIPLFLKVLAFDRQRDQRPEIELVVAVVYQGRYRSSATAYGEVTRALRKAAEDGRRIRAVPIDLDHDDVATVLSSGRVTLMYVAPLRGTDIEKIAAAAVGARITAITGVPEYVGLGVAVGMRVLGDRPKLMMNLGAARLGGADFSSELLKLAQVVP